MKAKVGVLVMALLEDDYNKTAHVRPMAQSGCGQNRPDHCEICRYGLPQAGGEGRTGRSCRPDVQRSWCRSDHRSRSRLHQRYRSYSLLLEYHCPGSGLEHPADRIPARRRRF